MHLDTYAINVLTVRDWPGNVRQLENTLRSAAARCLAVGGGALSSQHLHVLGAPPSALPTGDSLKESVAAFERQQVVIALAAAKGSRGEASKRLGISRQWLHRLMTREGLL
jgi:DNA-binding NtrC family response regulator